MKTNTNPPEFIKIVNAGKDIAEGTNYWETPHAKAGFFLFSTNAGCLRVLVPDRLSAQIPDMIRGAKHAVLFVRRGYDPAVRREDCCFLIEDGGPTPWVYFTSGNAVAGIPSEADAKAGWVTSIWGRKKGRIHKFMERPLLVQYVDELPFLEALSGGKLPIL